MKAKWKLDVSESTLMDGKKVNPVCIYEVDENDQEIEMVCECYEGEYDDRVARARLIAAAPELLEMLLEFADEYAQYSDKDIDHEIEMGSDMFIPYKKARAIIAKATGDAK